MKKTNIRIKNITLVDQINAIERIVSSYFVDGEYTPYYADQALIVAIVDNFIDGVEFEDNEDLYELSRTDDDIASIVLKFLTPKKEESEEPDYFGITSYVMNCVRDKVDGEYTPYYVDQALIVAIVDNFIDGVEFEDDEDLYELSRTDKDIASIVLKFFTPKEEESKEPDYFGITSYVMNCVRDKVDFMKQSIIHNTGKMQKITEFCDVMIDAFSNLANMATNKLTPEQMENATTVMKKLAESNMTRDDIVDIMKESAGFDMDKASAKNEQIKEKDKRINELANQVTDLRKYKEQNEAKNVLADK